MDFGFHAGPPAGGTARCVVPAEKHEACQWSEWCFSFYLFLYFQCVDGFSRFREVERAGVFLGRTLQDARRAVHIERRKKADVKGNAGFVGRTGKRGEREGPPRSGARFRSIKFLVVVEQVFGDGIEILCVLAHVRGALGVRFNQVF